MKYVLFSWAMVTVTDYTQTYTLTGKPLFSTYNPTFL